MEGTIWHQLALGAVALGGLLRLSQFARARFLWLDEAMLALNIGLRGPIELTQPLELAQTGPLLYLWLLKACAVVLGLSPWALRLPALVAGLLLPYLMWQVGRKILAPAPAAFATALAALAPGLVLYSRELKPYGVEATLSAAVLWAALAWRSDPRSSRLWWLLAGACLLNITMSIPGLLVVMSTLVALVTSRRLAEAGVRLRIAWLALASAALFALLVAVTYLDAAGSGYLQSFWSGTSLQAPFWRWPHIVREGLYAGARGLLLGKASVWAEMPGTAWLSRLAAYGGLVLAAVGWTGLLARGRRTTALMLSLPFAAVLAASALAGYPLEPRVLLFLAPQALLIMAAGLEEAARRVPGLLRIPIMTVVALAFLGPSGLRATEWTLVPPTQGDAGPVLAALEDLARKGDVVYVGSRGFPVWLYASLRTAPDRADETRRLARLASPGGPAFHSGPYPGAAAVKAARLETRVRGRLILAGAAPGIGFTAESGFLSDEPAAGWAAGEAARIMAAGSSCAVLVFPFDVDGSSEHLARALGAAGWRPAGAVSWAQARAVRLCRPTPPEPAEGA